MKTFFAALFFIFLLSCQNSPTGDFNLIRYIPKDTPVIIKTEKLSLLKSEIKNNDFIKALKNTTLYTQLENALESTAYLSPRGEVLLCFDEIGKQEFEYALITRYREDSFRADSLQGKRIDSISYDGALIRKITAKNTVFFTTVIDKVLIASSSQLFTENIIRQRHAEDPEMDATFYKLYETSDPGRSATVFIHNEKISALSGIFFERTFSENLKNFADWTSLEVSMTPDAITTTGIAMADPSSSKTITVFTHTFPRENTTAAFTPVGASGFVSFTFDDYRRFRANLAARYSQNTTRSKTVQNDSIFEAVEEIGVIFENESNSILVRTTAVEQLKERLSPDTGPVSEFREVPIYKCTNSQIINARFSPLISNAPVRLYAVMEEGILFSDSMAALQNCLTNYMNKATLGYNVQYRDFISGLNTEASVLMVGLQPGFTTSLQKVLSESYKSDAAAVTLEKYPYFAFQAIADRNFFHITSIVKKPAVKAEENTVTQAFSVILDADIALSPHFVVNHRTKQQEVVVQDVENTLYLISDKGKILWKKKLESAILGPVQQIDMYRNGRLQLAFVTRHKFHIMDRNGNFVTPFPMAFENAVTQPLAVFDYDKNRDYRFLVCQGRKLNMYNRDGKRVNGFTLNETGSEVLFTPKHFRIADKDYLVIPETNGTLNILHRTGETRVAVNRTIDFSDNGVFLYQNRFTTTDAAGTLIQIDQKGKITTKNLNLEPDHSMEATGTALVTLSENRLTINGKSATLDFGLYTRPRIFYVKKTLYVAVTDMQTNRVYVFNGNAELLPHFPVYGLSGIAPGGMDNDKKPEFVVQGAKNTVLLYHIH